MLSVYNDGETQAVEKRESGESSFGLTMVNILVDQLEGPFEIKQDRGTEFAIVFPYSP